MCSDQTACDNQTVLYETYEFMDYCIPVKSSLTGPAADNFDAAMTSFLNSAGGAPIYDLYKSKYVILGSVGISIFFAFCYIKFMDYCALQCAWISVVVVGLGFIGGGTACWLVRNDGLQSG